MIAPGASWTLPNLTGIPREYLDLGSTASPARLALSALTAGVADPRDWAEARHPAEFLQLTLRRWLAAHGADCTANLFTLRIVLADCVHPDASTWEPRQTDPGVAYLTLEPTGAAFCACGRTLRLLERVHPRLPVTFYRTLREALLPIFRVYDSQDAQDHVQMLRECLTEDEVESAEIPDIDGATPTCLALRPLTWRHARRLVAQRGSQAIQALFRALTAVLDACTALRPLARIRDMDAPGLESCDPPLPCLLLAFHDSDAIEGCFEAEMQEVDPFSQLPTASIKIQAHSPSSVRRAFDTLAAYCRLFVALTRLIALMPGHDGSPAR